MSDTPLGFMSYVRSDDEHENGRLSEFCKRLSGEVRIQTGTDFPIFQDRKDIVWGQQWQRRIDESLDSTTFLIPIITPGFFMSSACRQELERFLLHEESLSRGDLVLPVYYVSCKKLHDEAQCKQDPLVSQIARRNWTDWRDFRFEPLTSPQARKMLAIMATQIVDALERTPTAPSAPISIERKPTSSDSSILITDTGPAAEVNTGNPAQPRHLSDKTEPPQIVVDKGNRNGHMSVRAALKAAQPGDRILIRPGVYRESLIINKPVEIIGDGAPGSVVIEGKARPAIWFKASMGRIANLNLRQIGDNSCYCVKISQGRLELEDCDITSQSLACVAIHDGADPRLRRNRIHDSNQAGVFIYNNAQGTLEDNEIYANALAGIGIKSGSNPAIRLNRIHDGKQGGVLIYDNGLGSLEDNEIFDNALAGIEIKTGGNPTIRRNRIHDGKQNGVFIYDNGQGYLEDNEIFANALAGIEIESGGNPTIRRNRIHDGKSCGVLIHTNGQGSLGDNEIFANAHAGIAIETGGNPKIKRNRIHDGKQSGIFIYDNGRGYLEDNEIFANALVGISTKTGGFPTVRRNRIHRNGHEGIFIHEGGQGLFEENDLRENASGAWDIREDCLSLITRKDNLE